MLCPDLRVALKGEINCKSERRFFGDSRGERAKEQGGRSRVSPLLQSLAGICPRRVSQRRGSGDPHYSRSGAVAEKLGKRGNFTTAGTAGAKARLILLALSARLKSCPVTKLPLPVPERVFPQPLETGTTTGLHPGLEPGATIWGGMLEMRASALEALRRRCLPAVRAI